MTCLRRNLCGLTYVLYMTLDRDSAFADSRQGLIDKFCAVFPLMLVVLAYIFDSDDNMDTSKVNPSPNLNPNPNPNPSPNPNPNPGEWTSQRRSTLM